MSERKSGKIKKREWVSRHGSELYFFLDAWWIVNSALGRWRPVSSDRGLLASDLAISHHPRCVRGPIKSPSFTFDLSLLSLNAKVVSTPRWASPKKKKMNKRKVVSDTRGLKAVVADCTIHPLKHGAIQRAGLLRHCAGGGAELERKRERTVERNVKGGLESRTAQVRVILFSRRLWSVNSALAGGARSFQTEAASRRMAKVIINPGVHLELRIYLPLNFNASLGNTTTEIP